MSEIFENKLENNYEASKPTKLLSTSDLHFKWYIEERDLALTYLAIIREILKERKG